MDTNKRGQTQSDPFLNFAFQTVGTLCEHKVTLLKRRGGWGVLEGAMPAAEELFFYCLASCVSH